MFQEFDQKLNGETDAIAVISDIHSNVYALEEVLKDISERGIKTIVNLGDVLYGPIAPVETANLLMNSQNMINIMGNCDRILLNQKFDSPTFQYVKPLLSETVLQWIHSFKKTWVFEEMLFCHGTPDYDDAYLLEEITERGVTTKDMDALITDLKMIPQRMIFCGHTHLHKTVYLPDGKIIINPGSVGFPAYYEERPFPHHMESMSPHAKYVIVRRVNNSWSIEHILLPYDWEKASKLAEQNGRDDYAYAIRYGTVER